MLVWVRCGGVTVHAVRACDDLRRTLGLPGRLVQLRLATLLEPLVARLSDQVPAAEVVDADEDLWAGVVLLPEGWRGTAGWLQAVYKHVPMVYNGPAAG